MDLEIEKFVEAVEALENQPLVYSLNKEVREWLVSEQVSDAIIGFLNEFCFSRTVKFGNIYFNCPNEINVENIEEQNKMLLEHGLLIIGSGLNGDPVAINLDTGNIVFACHDILWEEEEIEISEVIHDTGKSIGAFYHGAQFTKDFPVDYYMASEQY